MRLAVSNLAWETHDDADVLTLLRDRGVAGIEVAPTKIWPDWRGMTVEAARAYRERMAGAGFAIVALQAILFQRADLRVFEPTTHPAFLDHFRLLARIAAALGARVLVFGSPKNRLRDGRGADEAAEIAAGLFRALGALCADHGVVVGIEPNPREYQCDFLLTPPEVSAFVRRVASPGVCAHFDTGAAALCRLPLGETIRNAEPFVHFHASEPMLAPFDETGAVAHSEAAATLRDLVYPGWISLEMKKPEPEEALASSVDSFVRAYRGAFAG